MVSSSNLYPSSGSQDGSPHTFPGLLAKQLRCQAAHTRNDTIARSASLAVTYFHFFNDFSTPRAKQDLGALQLASVHSKCKYLQRSTALVSLFHLSQGRASPRLISSSIPSRDNIYPRQDDPPALMRVPKADANLSMAFSALSGLQPTSDNPHRPMPQDSVTFVFAILIAMLTVGLNTVVIVAVRREEGLHHITYRFISSLCVLMITMSIFDFPPSILTEFLTQSKFRVEWAAQVPFVRNVRFPL